MNFENENMNNNSVENKKVRNKLALPMCLVTFLLIIETTAIVVMGILISVYVRNTSLLKVEKSETSSDEYTKSMEILSEIDKYYKGAYVNDITYDDLTLKMANSLIASYGDKYGVYLDPELAEESNAELNNEISGIGVLIRAELAETEEEIDRLYIIDVYDGSDALEKGMVPGSIITKMNGENFDFSSIGYNELISQIRGKAGTYVNLTFITPDGEEITADIERKNVETSTINYKVINNNIGYVNIRDFSAKTDEELENVLKYFENRKIEKIIFDLRDNSGGLLDTVVNMLDSLLPEQDLIYIEDKDKEIVETYTSDKKEYNFSGVCIINENTASASELFVKSLQEAGKVTVVGNTSYGKGTVCSVIPLENGGSLQLSTFKYLTSSKECLEGIGVIPDIEMYLPEEKEAIQYKLDIKDDDIIIESVKLLSE